MLSDEIACTDGFIGAIKRLAVRNGTLAIICVIKHPPPDVYTNFCIFKS